LEKMLIRFYKDLNEYNEKYKYSKLN